MELGRGGMGVVHLAVSRGKQGFVKLVVLKMLKRQLVDDERSLRQFMEEARISARLTHPNAVQVFEVVETDGAPSMVMEYLEGQSLWTIKTEAKERLPLPLELYVICQVLAGLHAAHELCDYDGTPLNLVHRDVSPHNVFVLYDGQVKVLDFGIAKAEGSEIETQTGEFKGKLRYMAPEQLGGGAQDRRVDVFAVGILLYEAVAGRRIWDGVDDGEVMLRLLSGKIPALPEEVELAEPLRRIVETALAPRPADRYRTAEELRQDLESCLVESGELASAAALGAHVSEHFDDARRSTRQLVDLHLKNLDRRHDPDGETVVAMAPSRAAPKVESRPRGRAWAIAGVGLVLVATGLAWAARVLPSMSGPVAASTGSPAETLACPTGFKGCDGECVSVDNPDFGCGGAECLSCQVANATPRCNVRGGCDIAVCYQDWDNCDGDVSNGCEANVRIDPDNCGACGRKCPELPHAERGCGDVCTIWRCQPGYRDCNGATADGCEVEVMTDAKNCGHCGVSCAAGEACVEGRCVRR